MPSQSSYSPGDQLLETLDRLRSRPAPGLQGELDFELNLFLSRLELLETRFLPEKSEDRIDLPRIRGQLYAFLKEDLVYFLHKIHSGNYHPPAGFPTLPDLTRDVADILRELRVYAKPGARDYSASTILERWYAGILKDGPLSAHAVLHYFAIYRGRLYALQQEKERPFLFENPASLVRHLIRQPRDLAPGGAGESADDATGAGEDFRPESVVGEQGLRFEEIYRAELKLREEIQMALLRHHADQYDKEQRRLDYLIAKQIVLDLSDAFITRLHQEFEAYYEERLAAQARLQARMAAEKDNLDRELRQAARLQARSIQKELPSGDPRLEFALWYAPFSTVGGDYYRVIPLEKDVYGIFVADITGHGISAAMHFNTVVNSFEKCSGYLDRPDKLLRKLNEDLYGQLRDHFLTAIYVRLDLRKRTLDYCNAGHPKAFLAALPDRESPGVSNTPSAASKDDAKNGAKAGADSARRRKVRFLRPNGKVIGAFRKAEFSRQTLPLPDRCRLILYTDGISETIDHRDPKGYKLLGERGLLDLFDAGTTAWDPQRTLDHIRASVERFQGAAAPEDDRTLLITDIDCLGERPKKETQQNGGETL